AAAEHFLIARGDHDQALTNILPRDEQLRRAQPDGPAVELGEGLLFLITEAGRLAGGRKNHSELGHGTPRQTATRAAWIGVSVPPHTILMILQDRPMLPAFALTHPLGPANGGATLRRPAAQRRPPRSPSPPAVELAARPVSVPATVANRVPIGP